MKRTIATLGVLGLGLMGATVAANAAPPVKIGVCLATGSPSNPYVFQSIDLDALGRVGPGDIVPANSGNILPNGQNLTPANIELLANGCVAPADDPPADDPPADDPPADDPPADDPPADDPPADDPPADDPPADDPPADDPPADDPPADDPPADPVSEDVTATAVVPSAVVPKAVVPKAVVPSAVTPQAPAAAVPAANNVGYNVQTAVGDKPGVGIPAWLAGLTGLFTAVAAAVLINGGRRSRTANG